MLNKNLTAYPNGHGMCKTATRRYMNPPERSSCRMRQFWPRAASALAGFHELYGNVAESRIRISRLVEDMEAVKHFTLHALDLWHRVAEGIDRYFRPVGVAQKGV